MQQASAALDVPMGLLKKAKAAGCPAFRGSRVYRAELEEWLREHRDEIVEKRSKEDVQIEKLLEECRKLRILNDQKEEKLVARSAVVDAHAKMSEKVRKLLAQKLENEYPSHVVGLEIPQARVYGKRLYDQIMAEFQRFSEVWSI